MKWLVIFALPIIAVILILPPTCIPAETYIWTDEGGHTIVSSEKPPAHITEFQTVGINDVHQKTDQTISDSAQKPNDSSKYNDIPPLILEKIEKASRDRWPGNKDAQEAMIARQVRACRYVRETTDEYYPSMISRIAEDIQKKWPNDYERQAIYLRKQCQAYEALWNYDNHRLSSGMIGSIKARAAERWPNDCVRQLQYLHREIEDLEENGTL